MKLPSHMWPKLPRSKVHASRSELLKLVAKWDKFKALKLFKCSEVDSLEAVGCFGVPKDSSFDRFILNPSVTNSRAHKLSCFTKLLAPGCLLAQASLPTDNHVLRVCCDDLSEMYYTFVVPPLRARRNCLGVPFYPHELAGFSAFNPNLHNEPCFLALNALAMGDCGAVENAQQSHFTVLASLGNSMRSTEFVAYRRPFPRSPCLEFLSIDDHMTAQVCSRAQLRTGAPLRDTAIFLGADAAYPAVGLVPHPGKRKRNVTSGVFLGADLDGLAGLVSAPRHRTGVLVKITAVIARRGCCSSSLLSSVVGLWIHVLLFRRPAFAVLSQVFVDARRTPSNKVLPLHRDTVNELWCLCAIAPLLQADLRASVPGLLFCMDASPSGAGLCYATLPSHVLQELWRHTEQKGFYTKLLEPASALLADLGLSDDPGAGFVDGISSASSPLVPEPLPLREPRPGVPSFVCLFGAADNWAVAHSRAGLQNLSEVQPWLADLVFSDLDDSNVFRDLCQLALSGTVHDWHASPPAASFMDRGCASRSALRPTGFNLDAYEIALDNTRVRRLCFLLCIAASAGSFVSVSQPAASLMFRLHCFRGLVAFGAVLTELSLCSFGSPCQRPTALLHNKPWLHKLGGLVGRCFCDASVPHFPSAGRFTAASCASFNARCRPSSAAVFGRNPLPGELVSTFCAVLPLPFACRAASGSSFAATGMLVPMPLSATLSTLHALGFSGLVPFPLFQGDCSFEARQFHDDPEWIGELADSLEFCELLRYKFLSPGHINVLETRAYKTWLKWCARHHPNSRIVGLIDSRVLLGSAAKGRSASPAICRVLRSTVPYNLGSGLYPGGLHVYSATAVTVLLVVVRRLRLPKSGPPGCTPLSPAISVILTLFVLRLLSRGFWAGGFGSSYCSQGMSRETPAPFMTGLLGVRWTCKVVSLLPLATGWTKPSAHLLYGSRNFSD